MNNLIPFQFNASTIRTLEVNGEVLFIAKDVAECLGYERPSDAVSQHCKNAKSLKSLGYGGLAIPELMAVFGTTSITVIPESDVYRLAMRSNLESAEKFQDWVVEDVLPSIRKTGGYQLQETKLDLRDHKQLTAVALQLIEINQEQAKKIEQKDQYITVSNEASIKAGEIMVRQFVKSNDLIDIGEKDFFKWMREQHIVMESNEPYQEYVKRGYFTWKPSDEMYGGKFRYRLRITPRGKVWLASRYMAYLDTKDFAPVVKNGLVSRKGGVK